MNIGQIRQKFPQYSDISDGELVRGLHQKFYADMPYASFLKSIDFTEKTDPTADMSGTEKFAAGAGKAIVDTGRGLGQLAGVVSEADVKESRELDKPLMDTGAGFAGNLAGNVGVALAPGGLLKGAGVAARSLPATEKVAQALSTAGNAMLVPKSFKGAAALGGGMGVIQPAESATERVTNTILGGGISAGAQAAPRALSRVISPQTRPEVDALIDAGVTPTPGQIMGGVAQKIEDKATSLPIVGDMITRARRHGVEDLNRAAINRVVDTLNDVKAPPGSVVPAGTASRSVAPIKEIGHEGVEKAGQAVSQAYDDLLPKLKVVADNDFTNDIQNLRQMAASLPPERAAQFEAILKSDVIGKFTPQGRMMGETMKEVESKLGTLIRKYGASPDGDQQLLADALKESQAALRRMVERSNPQYSGELSRINRAYAELLRVENAAARAGSKEGVFSPAGLRGAVRQMDSSGRKRSFARGNALMQDLAEAGENVLGPKYPDSGSAGRLMFGAGAAGGAALLDPTVLASVGAGSAAYTDPAQKVIAALLAQRPEIARQLGPKVAATAPYLTGASLPAIGVINASQ